MTTVLWVTAIVLIVVGVVGTVVPALPGFAFVFGGILLAAWSEGFTRVEVPTVVGLGVLAGIGLAIDLVAGVVFARRAGASRYGVIGAAIGTVAGIFTGLVGVIFLPLAGAFVGEFIAQRDALRAGHVGVATWVGLVVAAVLKLAIVFSMIGVFVVAVIF
jgi:hypothetical protein